MPITPKNPVATTGPKVQATRQAQPATEPPEGWQQKTTFGFMGHDSTPAGRLVRLADVLRWLGEHPHPLPYAVALEALCNVMPGDVMQWLYQVQPSGGYAQPVPVDCMFGYQTVKQIEDAGVRAMQDRMRRDVEAERSGRFGGIGLRVESRRIVAAPPQPTEPGLPALLRRIRAVWATEKFRDLPTIDHSKPAINYLAIPFNKAAQHWGWGVIAQVEAEDSASPANKEVGLVALLEAYEKRGPKKTRKQFAMDQGLTEPNLKKLLGEARALREKKESNPFANLIAIGGKKVANK